MAQKHGSPCLPGALPRSRQTPAMVAKYREGMKKVDLDRFVGSLEGSPTRHWIFEAVKSKTHNAQVLLAVAMQEAFEDALAEMAGSV